MNTSHEERRAKIRAATPKQTNRATLTIVSAIVALLIVGGLVWALMANRTSGEDTQKQVANATTPPNATSDGGGIVANPGKAKEGAPTLVIYQDYQCPICKEVEDLVGPTVQKLADGGKIRLEYHIRSFLDTNIKRAMGGKEPNPESSLRTAAATACADIAGVMPAYHAAVYGAQPEEGEGYSDEQIRTGFAKKSGLSGEKLSSFQACVDGGAMKGYAAKMEQVGGQQGNTGTPEYKLNGQTLDLQDITADPTVLERHVASMTR